MTHSDYLTLSGAAKKYWRIFLPVWLVPFIYLLASVGRLAEHSTVLLVTALFFAAGIRCALKKAHGADLHKNHVWFLSVFGPFLVWAALLGLFFAVWIALRVS